MKKLLKNKWFWILLIVAFLLYWSHRSNPETTTATPDNRTGTDTVLNAWQGVKTKVRYWVTLLNYNQSKFEMLCQRTREARADGLLFNVEIGRFLNPDGSYNWTAYDYAFETMAKYNLLIDVKFMTQMTAGQAFALKNLITDADWMKGNDGRSDWENQKILSYSSPKWETIVYPALRAFLDRYQKYRQLGYIKYIKPSNTPTHEFSYPGDALCDFSQVEQNAYGGAIPNNAGDLNFYRFRTLRLKRVFDKMAEIVKGKGYKIQVDNGSTVDELSQITATYGNDYWAGAADSFKENPDFSYDKDFVYSKILSSAKRRNVTACVEITWTRISDLTERRRVFLEWVRQAADWGIDDIYFSFLDPTDNTAFGILKSLLTDLNTTGHLTKNVPAVQFAGSVTYTLSEFIQAKGHQNPSIMNRFQAVRQPGKPVNLSVTYNL